MRELPRRLLLHFLSHPAERNPQRKKQQLARDHRPVRHRAGAVGLDARRKVKRRRPTTGTRFPAQTAGPLERLAGGTWMPLRFAGKQRPCDAQPVPPETAARASARRRPSCPAKVSGSMEGDAPARPATGRCADYNTVAASVQSVIEVICHFRRRQTQEEANRDFLLPASRGRRAGACGGGALSQSQAAPALTASALWASIGRLKARHNRGPRRSAPGDPGA